MTVQRTRRSPLLALLAGLLLAGSAQSMVIFDNGVSLANSGMWSEKDRIVTPGSANTWLIQAGDTFRLDADVTLGAIRWWGWNNGDLPLTDNSFEIALHAFNNGVPEATPFYSVQPVSVSRVAVGDFQGSFAYESTLAPVALSAGMDYLLVIVNDFGTPADLTDAWVWRRSMDGPDGRHAARQSITATPGSWVVGGFTHDLAFQLLSPVPELPTPLLGGVGLMGLCWLLRRRRRVA